MSSAGSYSSGGGGGVGNVKFLTGNSGGPVGPDGGGNINLVGTGDITVVDTPGTNTLTIQLTGAIANVYDADSGSAIPALGILNINGLGGITTTASGNTILVENDGTLADSYTADSGTASPAAGNLNILGGSGITTSASGSTITITASGGGVTSITGDTGSAQTGALTLTGGTSGAVFAGLTGTITESFKFLALPDTDAAPTQGYISINNNVVFATYGGTANHNICVGVNAGNSSMSGTDNCIMGNGAGVSLTNDSDNIAIGLNSLQLAAGGGNNVSIGSLAMRFLTGGAANTAIGASAGRNYTGNESGNICIGTSVLGTVGESHAIHIGDSGSFTTCFVGGIYGVTVGSSQFVTVDSAGQLGSTASAGGVASITGNSGGAQTGAITLTGGTSGAVFTGSAGTITESFNFLNMADTNTGGTTGYLALGGTAYIAAYGGIAANNVFIGNGAGVANLGGTDCIGIGSNALNSLSSTAFAGSGNIGIGTNALTAATTSTVNLAIGQGALGALATGSGENIALGELALQSITTGANNIAIGVQSANAYTTSESNNITIGANGTVSESNVLRIGTSGSGTNQVNKCFIAGIAGVTVANNAAVLIDTTNGQLGTVISSARYKENIHDIGPDSRSVINLRPVEFNYKNDDSKRKQYGLIAEEVEQAMPYLVVRNDEGQPETVKYHELPTLLLAEIQRLESRLKSLEEQFAARVR